MAEPGKIAIACDHAGVRLKDILKAEILTLKGEVLDLGTNGTESVDYPDFADRLVTALGQGEAKLGILICGSGIGMSIAANRHRHIRAALCAEPVSARLARQHNDANVLVIGARLVGEAVAIACLKEFLQTDYEAGRHARRVQKLS